MEGGLDEAMRRSFQDDCHGEVMDFAAWLRSLPYEHKVLILAAS